MKKIIKVVDWLNKNNLYPNVPEVRSHHAPELVVGNKKVLMFATNNYLGLMHDSRVIDSAKKGLEKWGIGNGSARLLTGNLEIHQQLENSIARFKNRESALTFVSGYMANSGAIPSLARVLNPSIASLLRGKIVKDDKCIIFSDEFNHASIIAGIKMSGVHKEIYKHVDILDLESKLKKYSKNVRKIIITDGVFSMDGDMAPLPNIVLLAKKYNAMVYLDDAHATGILGEHGRGLEDHYHMEGNVDVVMGTFTKAFGGVGGFVVGSKYLVDYLKVTADTFIFTAPIAPPVVCGLIKSVELAEEEVWRRNRVLENASYLRESLLILGFDLCNSSTQIIPIIIGEEKKALRISALLYDKYNIFIPAARWPAVPKGSARLRTTVSCEHTKEQIDYLIASLKDIKRKLKF